MDIQSIFSDVSLSGIIIAFLTFSLTAVLKSYFGAFGKFWAENTLGKGPLLLKILREKAFEITSFGVVGVLLVLVISGRSDSGENNTNISELSSRVNDLELRADSLEQRRTVLHQWRIFACEAFPINLLQHTDEENFDKLLISTGKISVDAVQGRGSQKLGNNAVRYFYLSERLDLESGQLLVRLEVGVSDETNSGDGSSFGCDNWRGSAEERRRNWADIVLHGVEKR